ncbi:MAG: sulfatase [Planctomycetota bacterium]
MGVLERWSIAGVVAVGLTVSGCGTGAAEPPHVVLVMLDTLRADHLHCYGYERETSPVLDALARESVLFERVLSTACATGPSQMSLMTGTLPAVHGITNGGPGWPSPDLPVLAEVLADAGYRSVAFADGGILKPDYGFDRGFDLFESEYEPFDRKLDRLLGWLDGASEAPTFLFVHTYGIHAPYVPLPGHDLFSDPNYDGPVARVQRPLEQAIRQGGQSDLTALQLAFWRSFRVADLAPADTAHLRDLYDGSIHGVDAQLGRLFDRLEREGWLDDGWLVVTSDHGEAFGEHGSYQHRQPYQEELHVPLLVRPPGGVEGRRLSSWRSQLDLAPSLLSWLGLDVPGTMEGRPFELDPQRDHPRPAFAAWPKDQVGVLLDPPLKLITRERGAVELYDLDVDEQTNRATVDPAGLERLLGRLEARREAAAALLERVGPPLRPNDARSPERIEELRALGYDG